MRAGRAGALRARRDRHALRGDRPWHAGLLVYVVLVLTSSLLATPWVAAGLEFGHLHTNDEPPHVHDIDAILTGAVTAAVVSLPSGAAPISWVAARPQQPPSDDPLVLSRAIRAPPAAGL